MSLEDMDGELVQVKAELLRVKDMLKIRDAEFEEQLHELKSANAQVGPPYLTGICVILVGLMLGRRYDFSYCAGVTTEW